MCALLLRLLAANNPLWLDEIWSIRLAQQADHWSEVFTGLHHDNNHMLNTLWLRTMDGWQHPVVLRSASIVAGVLTVMAAGWVTRRHGRRASRAAIGLTASSYLLIHYSSEARGYALATCAALLAIKSITEYAREPNWRWACLFGIGTSIGILAHLSFVGLFVAAALWLTLQRLRDGQVDRFPRDATCLYATPTVCLVFLYWFHFRHLTLGGGPDFRLGDVLLNTGSITIGGPLGDSTTGLFATVFVVLFVAALQQLRRERDPVWSLYALIVALPLVTVCLRPPAFLFERYFLLSGLVAQLVLAIGLSRIWNTTPVWRRCAIGLFAVWIVGNGLHLQDLVQHGRGQYPNWISHLCFDKTAVRVSSDHDHGVELLLDYYGNQAGIRDKVTYVSGTRAEKEPLDWLVLHDDGSREIPSKYVLAGREMQKTATFPAGRLSGWTLHCFRAAD